MLIYESKVRKVSVFRSMRKEVWTRSIFELQRSMLRYGGQMDSSWDSEYASWGWNLSAASWSTM